VTKLMLRLNARSSPAGYVVLAGIWFLLGALFVWCAFYRQGAGGWKTGIIGLQVAAMCFAVASLWIVWLRGFRLRINGDVFEYRNGLYQTRSCPLADIEDYEVKWIKWQVLWRRLKVPRGVVAVRNQDPILINIKPFSRADLAALRHLLV